MTKNYPQCFLWLFVFFIICDGSQIINSADSYQRAVKIAKNAARHHGIIRIYRLVAKVQVPQGEPQVVWEKRTLR